jgi:hypothetical protein
MISLAILFREKRWVMSTSELEKRILRLHADPGAS